MRQLKIWPIIFSTLVCGCSIQQQTDRAERRWLSANSLSPALHRVKLAGDTVVASALNPKVSPNTQPDANKRRSFLYAQGAKTYLRGHLLSPQIRELSGMSPVLGETDKYWAINDSGNRPQLFAVDGNGANIATINLSLQNRDWEDLSSYRYHGENWIAIAETGDNLERYPVSSIVIFKQPDFQNLPQNLQPYKRIDFTYQDGPRNVESMAISPSEGRVYLIAKDKSDQAIYSLLLSDIHTRLSASNQAPERLAAFRVGELSELRTTRDDAWWERMFAGRILLEATGADISPDDRTAVVANYRHVYLYKRREGETWAAAFSRTPEILTSHRMQQSESVAFSANGAEIIVGSEGANAPLLAIRPLHRR